MKVQGQVCWVSGAAQGIGLELCKLLAADGGKVVMVDVCDETKGQTAVKEVEKGAKNGGCAAFVRADMSEIEQVRRALEQAKIIFGEVATIVSHNAGIVAYDEDLGKVQKMLAINTNAMIIGSCIASEMILAAGKKGVIVNTASMAGIIPTMNTPAYAGSKWAVVGFTLSSENIAKKGIRINCVCPNLVDTPAVGTFFEKDFMRGGKTFQRMAKEKLDASKVARVHLSAIYDDDLFAKCINVMYSKTAVHDPLSLKILSNTLAKDKPDYFIEESKL